MPDGPRTLLFIDEDPAILEGLRALHEWEGGRPLIARTREEVIAALREHPQIAVVVEDIPRGYPLFKAMGGIVLTPYDDVFAAHAPGIPRLFMSASPLPGLVTVPLYLQKPFMYEELQVALEAMLPGARRLLYASAITDLSALASELIPVNDELLRFLARHPEALREVGWRKFEEIVAELLARSGFIAELQRGTKDGGIDVIAAKHAHFGDLLMLVQCKQTANPVSVEIVREMYGVTMQRRATMGIVATTSYFTRDAKEFQKPVAATLTLRDFEDLTRWLRGISPP